MCEALDPKVTRSCAQDVKSSEKTYSIIGLDVEMYYST